MTISQVGQLLNVLGTVAIFFFGLPSPIINPENQNTLLWKEPSAEERQKIFRSNFWKKSLSYIGLLLILLGFAFQFVSDLLKG